MPNIPPLSRGPATGGLPESPQNAGKSAPDDHAQQVATSVKPRWGRLGAFAGKLMGSNPMRERNAEMVPPKAAPSMSDAQQKGSSEVTQQCRKLDQLLAASKGTDQLAVIRQAVDHLRTVRAVISGATPLAGFSHPYDRATANLIDKFCTDAINESTMDHNREPSMFKVEAVRFALTKSADFLDYLGKTAAEGGSK